MRSITALALMLSAATSAPAFSQQFGAAPSGEATVVAQRVIHANFDKRICPLVVSARRVGDGSIRAQCNNRERFMVFGMQGKAIAMRCSIAEQLGVKGC